MVNIVDIYDNDSLIDLVAGVQLGLEPDPLLGIGRECYAFSPEEDRAFQVIEEKVLRLFEEYHLTAADFSIQKDGIGNLFVTLYGQDESRSVMSGSHVDSVYMGGKYDGVAGVQSAYNFLRKLLEHQRQTKRSASMNYTFAVFRAEESSPKTGSTCIGSRVATGTISQQELEKIRYKVDGQHSISFKDHFILRYGIDCWNQVLEDIQKPRLNKDTVVAYEELHIEQSAVCDTNDADVGVVIDGIGGSIRQMVEMNVRPNLVQEFEVTPELPHTRIVLRFLGEEAHSGGTPPNPTFEVEPGVVRYRKDALIAALQFVRTVIEQGYSSNVKFLDFDIPHEVGFTTVPAQQNVELAVPDILYEDFAGQLVWMTDYIQSKMGVSLDISMDSMRPGTYHSYHSDIFQALDIPLTVENEVRLKCLEQIVAAGGGVGKVRGTTTDFRLSKGISSKTGVPHKPTVSMKLDYRDVDPQSMTEIRGNVYAKIIDVMKNLMTSETFQKEASTSLKASAKKKYVPVDPDGVREKISVAQRLGLKVMAMPSLPGHDAASLGAAGIPISMTFVRHDGRSHSAYETMPQNSYRIAEDVSHTFLMQKLGLVPNPDGFFSLRLA